jgi:hypothetical protein
MSTTAATAATTATTATTATPATASVFLTHKGKVYQEEILGPWSCLRELPTSELKNSPDHRWLGPKIPIDQQKAIIAFFEWGQAETKSEVMLHGFWNETLEEWKWVAFPQEGYKGMTVSMISGHPRRTEVYQQQLGADPRGGVWEPMATAHMHCTAPAFQSGTDSADEKSKEGLHITIGSLGDKRYSIHARTSVRGVMFPAVLADWFEIPEAVASGTPYGMHEEIVTWQLTTPTGGAPFPDWWKENVIKIERSFVLPQQHHNPVHRSWQAGDNFGRGPGHWEKGQWVAHNLPAPTPTTPAHHGLPKFPGGEPAEAATKTAGEVQERWFMTDILKEILPAYVGASLEDVADFLTEATDPFNSAIVSAMVQYGVELDIAARLVNDAIEKEAELEADKELAGFSADTDGGAGVDPGPGASVEDWHNFYNKERQGDE